MFKYLSEIWKLLTFCTALVNERQSHARFPQRKPNMMAMLCNVHFKLKQVSKEPVRIEVASQANVDFRKESHILH